MSRHVLMLVILLIALPMVLKSIAIHGLVYEDIYTEFLDLYKRVVELARKGVDVSSVYAKLKEVHELMLQGRLGEAKTLLDSARADVDRLSSKASEAVLMSSVLKGVYIAFLASIPILVYFLLPRVYLYAWYRSRRRWVVKTGSTR